jgi:hypothetical protein
LKIVRKIPTPNGLALILAAIAFGIGLIVFSSTLDHSRYTSLLAVIQTVVFLAGTLISWYFSHPLFHYLTAKISGVRTSYFYIGRSELRNVGFPLVGGIASHLITIGTKLDRSDLAKIRKSGRAFIYGSGAIGSACIVAGIFLGTFVLVVSFLCQLFVLLFFLFSVANEIVLSTRSGDLAKMKKEMAS